MIYEQLEQLRKKALENETLKDRLLETKQMQNPLQEFCKVAGENGCTFSPMDIIVEGEEMYASMKRSTNGGGENSPVLEGWDDPYEMFLADLKSHARK